MVQQGHFEIELVRTTTNGDNDERKSFREHWNPRDNKTYVEAEMGQEYFIGLRKTKTVADTAATGDNCDGLICCLYVDGKDLGYEIYFHNSEIHLQHNLSGLWSYDGVTSTERALKFQEPRFRGRGGSDKMKANEALHSAVLGSVTVQVFSGHVTGKLVPRRPCDHDPFSLPTFKKNNGTNRRLKYLRSAEGSSEKQWTPSNPKYMKHFEKDQFLYSVTLLYGDASDLLKIGLFDNDDTGATGSSRAQQQRALNEESKARIVLEKMMGEIDMVCDDDDVEDNNDFSSVADDGVVEDLFASMDME